MKLKVICNKDGNNSQDGQISAEMIQSTDPDCVGKVLLKNETDFATIGGFSLELFTDAQNADFVILDTHKILLPGAPIDIILYPKDPGKAAIVKIQGQMTLSAFAYDFAFYALISVMKQAAPLCIIPHETMAHTALRLLNITSGASNLFANGKYIAAKNEFSRIFEAIVDSINEEAGPEIAKSCGEYLVFEILLKKKLDIFLDLIEWLAPWYSNYFKGEWSYLTLSYTLPEGAITVPEPASTIIPTPTPTVETSGGPSDPTYVYEQVKKAIKFKDASYLEEFYDSEHFQISGSRIVACQINDDWVVPPLEVIEEHMNGELKCEGIQFESRRLSFYYSGWNPDWIDCTYSGNISDTGAINFYRTEVGGNYKLAGIGVWTILGANARCCGHTGIEPYIEISCDTEFIPDIEQAICPGALPQRLKIGDKGTSFSRVRNRPQHSAR
jgi:hypothetical protein